MTRLRQVYLLALVVASVFAVTNTSVASASERVVGKVASGELVEHPKTYDGKTIEFTGEVIGESMERGDHAWVHLNDDAYMLKNVEEGAELVGYNSGMPVWAGVDFTRKITTFGDYKHEGDIAKVVGVFHAACREHGGDMDIHADALTVVNPGHPAKDPIHPWKLGLALGLVAAAILAWAADRRLKSLELGGWLRGK